MGQDWVRHMYTPLLLVGVVDDKGVYTASRWVGGWVGGWEDPTAGHVLPLI